MLAYRPFRREAIVGLEAEGVFWALDIVRCREPALDLGVAFIVEG